jgi:hypothetical protein
LGLGQRQIARSCSIGLGTVSDYLSRAAAAGVSWPLPEGWDDEKLEAALFRRTTPAAEPSKKPQPDWAALHEQLRKPHVTLQLLWEEYREANPEGYRYSRFCELYQRWRKKQDVVLRQVHKPGEKMFLDWAGVTIPIHDRHTGQTWQAALFVSTLGVSSYTARLFERILEDKPHPEMGYRSCLGIIRLADQYSPARMESAALLALTTGACRYQSIKSILKNSLDLAAPPPPLSPPAFPPPPHDNVRGADYFDAEGR